MKRPSGDPVGEASGNRAEMRRMGDVILDRVEAQSVTRCAPAGGRDDEIADDGALGQDLGARAGLRADQDLV